MMDIISNDVRMIIYRILFDYNYNIVKFQLLKQTIPINISFGLKHFIDNRLTYIHAKCDCGPVWLMMRKIDDVEYVLDHFYPSCHVCEKNLKPMMPRYANYTHRHCHICKKLYKTSDV